MILVIAEKGEEVRARYDRPVEGKYSALVSAEPGWRALFADAGGIETGRSRVIAWASLEQDGAVRIVGIIADPNDPKSLVPADSVVDEDGGALQRYGFPARGPDAAP